MDKIDLMLKRDLERKSDLEQRKITKSHLQANNEKLDYFQETFNLKYNQTKEALNKAIELPQTDLANHFNEIFKQILNLQKYVAASNLFLRSYDLKKCQESVQELTTQAKELEETLMPKKKFGFKTKQKPKAKIVSKDETDFYIKPTIINDNFCGLSNKSNCVLTMANEEINKNDVLLENLENCIVKLIGTASTLHINNVKNCQIFSGPVLTSIFVDNCENSTLVVACQQLRLHTSNNLKIYLYVTSRAIMEDCQKIYFAPYNWHYSGFEDDFSASGLDKMENNWKCIDDFNWLNLEKQSPHWGFIKNEDLVNCWI